MRIQSVRGTNDILPADIWKWRFLEEKARGVFSAFGCEEIRTPIFERTELFIRSAGETSDIVEKQMYTIPPPAKVREANASLRLASGELAGGGTIPDEKGSGLTLRPEATAPVVRAFLEHQMDQEDRFHKFFYIGPMFRHERPQAGRLRQFHQMGVEVIGATHPAVDVEVLELLKSLLESFGLSEARFKINSVGCSDCKARYSGLLRDSLRNRLSDLCLDCQRRFEKNVLRVLDCKNPQCQSVLDKIPLLPDVLCEPCQNHFTQVKALLNQINFSFELAPRLVRGLDYYTRTIFEVTHSSLGAQDAIAAGGRYDQLIKSMGGPSLGAVGFAMGMERLLLSLGDQIPAHYRPKNSFLFLASLGEQAFQANFLFRQTLRKSGISCEMDYDFKSLKSQMRRANKLGVRYVLLRGDDELARGVVKLKDMEKSSEEEMNEQETLKVLEERSMK